ncbi:MAG: hypothetical protein ACN0LA_05055 [Candidatus Longimicrobiales bacterium M2_2A_002]
MLFRRRSFLVEVFAALNLTFLALDIWVAHSVNEFGHWAEWIPFWFTLAGAAALLVNLALATPARSSGRGFKEGAGLWTGVVVGAASILVGVAGLLFHLESNFFQVMTLRSLVYSAPFVAPLAFTGLGLLVLLNRTVPGESREWGRWVLLLAWGGFVGNFVLSLVDHAQNGFFHAAEWIPVIVGGVVVGWLVLPIFWRVPERYLRGALALLVVALVTGVVGFVLHAIPVMRDVTGTLEDRVIYGAPLFAPLLFSDLALLGGLAVWDLMAKGWVSAERGSPASRGPGP